MRATTAKAVVERGAKLLDKKLPGWHNKVAITSLNMGSACHCVLGQVGGKAVNLDRIGWHDPIRRPGFNDMTELIGLDDFDDIARNGFDFDMEPWSYSELRAAWIDEIRARRKAQKAAAR